MCSPLLVCSFQAQTSHSATFPQINGKSISFDEQTVQRLSVDAPLPTQSRSFDTGTLKASSTSVSVQAQQNQNSEGNSLHSLSSDSGLHTEKTSELSSGEFNSKVEEDEPTMDTGKESPASGCDASSVGSKPTPVRLSRVGSVKSRVNIFQQQQDNKQNTTVPSAVANNATESKRPVPKKRKLDHNLLLS